MLADVGFWPLAVLWAVAIFISRAQKAKRAQQQREAQFEPPPLMPERHPAARHENQPAVEPEQRGLMDELRRAMEDLKRAELQQRARERSPAESGGSEPVETRAHAYLEQRRKAAAPTRRQPVVQRRPSPFVPRKHEPTFDEEPSSEAEAHEEGTDYDMESQRLADVRRAETSTAWHAAGDLSGQPDRPYDPGSQPPEAVRAAKPLARFANGTARSAFIASLILGRPRSESPDV